MLIPASEGSAARFLLFVRPRDFAAEQWTGWRAGVEGAKKDFGAEAYPIAEFWSRLPALAAPGRRSITSRAAMRPSGESSCETWNAGNANALAPRPAADASPILAELRLVKDAAEIDLLRAASRISAEAHRAAMAEVAPGRRRVGPEGGDGRHVPRARRRADGVSADRGLGRNGVVLHYVDDDASGSPTARSSSTTPPASTGCTPPTSRGATRCRAISPTEQRKIYEIVLAAQKAGFAAVKPGAAFHEVHDATVRVVVDGLLALGILTGDRAEILRTRAYQKFYPHGSSHWVGLNVHDAGSYQYPPGVERLARYGVAQTKLEPGMVLTVEPGIYIPAGGAPDPRWNDLGARVEDVVLVTATGMECLSCGAPREIADVEKAIAEGRGEPDASAALTGVSIAANRSALERVFPLGEPTRRPRSRPVKAGAADARAFSRAGDRERRGRRSRSVRRRRSPLPTRPPARPSPPPCLLCDSEDRRQHHEDR